jgi:hypothetical protein
MGVRLSGNFEAVVGSAAGLQIVAFSCKPSRKTTAFRSNYGHVRTLSLRRGEVNWARAGWQISPGWGIDLMSMLSLFDPSEDPSGLALESVAELMARIKAVLELGVR